MPKITSTSAFAGGPSPAVAERGRLAGTRDAAGVLTCGLLSALHGPDGRAGGRFFLVGRRDVAAALVGQAGPGPVRDGLRAVLGRGQEGQVHGSPGQEGG